MRERELPAGTRTVRAGAAALALLALVACGEPGDAGSAPVHPWVTAAPPVDEAAVVLPAWLVHPLAPGRRAEAVAELADEPYVQISPGMASHYVGREVGVPAEMRPFLVRAVAPVGALAELAVVQSRNGLWARVRAPAAGALEAAPVVVLVDPTPRDIFVTLE